MSATTRSEELAAVADCVRWFIGREQRLRLRLYRLHLQATIRSVSPLTADLAAGAGLDLDTVAHRLPAPRGWAVLALAPMAPESCPSHTLPAEAAPCSVPLAYRLGRAGVAIRGADAADGELGFLPDGSVLESVTRIGPYLLHSNGPRSNLFLKEELPETAAAGLIGHPIDVLIRHEVLTGRDYIVENVFTEEFGGGTVVQVATGLIDHRLPWAADLAGAVKRRRARRGSGSTLASIAVEDVS